jgi:hypothetical protein
MKTMKTKSVLGGCVLALVAVASVAAYAQMWTAERAGTHLQKALQLAGARRLPHSLSVLRDLGRRE